MPAPPRILRTLFAAGVFLLSLAPAGAEEKAPAPAALTFPKGAVVERVVCRADANETYALYLPSTYSPSRRWPIVYAFDARGRAQDPMERFRAGAETYGYIVASSYNSASDGPIQPNFAAMQAMWNDTHQRFAIDDKRIYAAGFSGTVRAACIMAAAVPGSITGVIGAGAGFPFDQPPTKDTPFLFFGTIGNVDFNYYEMQDLENRLRDLHLPHRIAEWVGAHEWMPAELATAALGYMEVQAMKAGTRAKDAAVVDALWQQDLAAARVAEAAGRPFDAWRRYTDMAGEFTGVRDAAEATAKAAELGATKAVKEAQKERELRQRHDLEYIRQAQQTLGGAQGGGAVLGRVIAELRIPELKAKAEKQPESDDALSARRLLNTLAAQTGFYLPRQAAEKKDYARAAFFLSIAAEIHPQEPYVWYNLAAAHARDGNRKKAVEELKRAAELGFHDADELEHNAAFESLRGEAGYKEALEAVKKQAANKA